MFRLLGKLHRILHRASKTQSSLSFCLSVAFRSVIYRHRMFSVYRRPRVSPPRRDNNQEVIHSKRRTIVLARDWWSTTAARSSPQIDIRHAVTRGALLEPSSEQGNAFWDDRASRARARARVNDGQRLANKFLLTVFTSIPGTEGRERCQRRICEY